MLMGCQAELTTSKSKECIQVQLHVWVKRSHSVWLCMLGWCNKHIIVAVILEWHEDRKVAEKRCFCQSKSNQRREKHDSMTKLWNCYQFNFFYRLSFSHAKRYFVTNGMPSPYQNTSGRKWFQEDYPFLSHDLLVRTIQLSYPHETVSSTNDPLCSWLLL